MANKKKRRKKNVILIIFLTILILIIGAGIYAGMYISNKLSALNIEEIDTSDLDVNEELYNEVADTLSRNEFENIITFALFGTDSRDTNTMSAGRSDCIIIASINTNNHTLKLISIPRDTYVTVEGYGKTKINRGHTTNYIDVSFENNENLVGKIVKIQYKK